eukprot:TRINITY_DN22859_c0_g3_i1.p1 TRINITY_DN22859_c0_g3~~TRINITY_DN22859_c0_g3_i1.p1  ORF type:complete len:456 (+),score=30.21 TRINITY_DN22859_c0_g3_i1:91-1458(+)
MRLINLILPSVCWVEISLQESSVNVRPTVSICAQRRVRAIATSVLGDLAERVCEFIPQAFVGYVWVQDLTWNWWGEWVNDKPMGARQLDKPGQQRLMLVDSRDPGAKVCTRCVVVDTCMDGDKVAALSLLLLELGASDVYYLRFALRERPECHGSLESLRVSSASEPTLLAWLKESVQEPVRCGQRLTLPRVAMDRHLSDKGSLQHQYTRLYDILLPRRRCSTRSVLEVGIGSTRDVPSQMRVAHVPLGRTYRHGASLRGWRDVFPFANVSGLDVDRAAMLNSPRIVTHVCNTLNVTQVREVLGETMYDLIVDDGLHTAFAQRATMRALWPHLRSGGYYVVEDLDWSPLSKDPDSGFHGGVVVNTGGSAPVYLAVKSFEPLPGVVPRVPGLAARYNACWVPESPVVRPSRHSPAECCGKGGIYPPSSHCFPEETAPVERLVSCCDAYFARHRALA